MKPIKSYILLFLFFGDQMLLEKAKSRHFPPVGVVRDAVSYPERGYFPRRSLIKHKLP